MCVWVCCPDAHHKHITCSETVYNAICTPDQDLVRAVEWRNVERSTENHFDILCAPIARNFGLIAFGKFGRSIRSVGIDFEANVFTSLSPSFERDGNCGRRSTQ